MAAAAPAIFAGIGAAAAGAIPATIFATVFVNAILTGLSVIDDSGEVWSVRT